jgi:hypothetical protein
VKAWHERVTDALEGPAPRTLYHATTPRKLARYQTTGAILPPVRGFDTLAGAQEWARLTNGRSIILRAVVQHAQALPDHHNAHGLAWWSPVACKEWEEAK